MTSGVPRSGAQGDGERERREDRGSELDPERRRCRSGPVDGAEPVRGDRAADRDAEREPEELHERARRVGDPRLEVLVDSSCIPIVSVMPGRSVTSAASVTTSGEASKPSRTSSAAAKLAATAAIGATIGSVRAVRPVESAIAPTTSPTSAAAAASRQPPPSSGVSATPASA